MTVSPLALKTGDKGISSLCLDLGERRGEGRRWGDGSMSYLSRVGCEEKRGAGRALISLSLTQEI